MKTLKFTGLLSLAVASTIAMTPGPARAQATSEDGLLEEIVTTGTRREGQSPTETLSPIDVLSGSAFVNQSTFDVTEALTKIAPSLNTQRFPIADGTAVIRPVTLRNMSPDQTLVLVNGSRRHRSALVNLQFSPLGTINTGAHPVDFGLIPSLAIKRVEILRDGASAQYGSDAIAGVVNVILNDASEGITLSAQTGEYFEGDGGRMTLAANAGFALGANGFVNATVEVSEADRTSRGNVRFDCPDRIAAVGVENVPLNGLCQRWGDPDVETTKLFLNAGIDLNDEVELFGTLSFGETEFRSDFFYRPGYIAGSGGSGALVVDDGNGLPADAPQALVDDIVGQGLDPADYLTPDATSASGFELLNPIQSQFPGGFNPDFGADINDFAALFGLRGESTGGWGWDIRGRIAENEVDYLLGSTINPSLGRLSPTSFKPGALTQEESALTVDIVKAVDFGKLASPLNIAFGAEWREETYTIEAGDPDSIEVGPTFLQFGFGSEAFQGYPLESAGEFDSSSVAAYVDFEADLTDKISGGAAIRFEDYDAFGSTFDWKLSGRVEVTDQFALRGTVNTGFRAPTTGQINTLNGTTAANSAGILVPQFIYPVADPIAAALGSQSLQPEESTSFTIGAVFEPTENTSITVDYYDVTIDDRLTVFNVNPDGLCDGSVSCGSSNEIATLAAAGIANPQQFLGAKVAYFINGFESQISGFDVSIVSDFSLGSGVLTADLRANFNDHKVKKILRDSVSASDVFDFENQVPENRTTLTLNYQTDGLLSGYVRFNHYGEWGDSGGQLAASDASEAVTYGSEILVDVEANFRITDNLRFAVGGENVFDTFPDNDGHFISELLGIKYSLTSPFGFNGGFWYARLAAEF
jgi:iron complex outermembrane receptor protein